MTGTCDFFEKEYFRKDGSRVPVLVGAAAVDRPGGQVMAFVLDITDRKRAEAAEAAERAKDKLLADAGHEVRTPGNVILGTTGLVLDTPLTDDQR